MAVLLLYLFVLLDGVNNPGLLTAGRSVRVSKLADREPDLWHSDRPAGDWMTGDQPEDLEGQALRLCRARPAGGLPITGRCAGQLGVSSKVWPPLVATICPLSLIATALLIW